MYKSCKEVIREVLPGICYVPLSTDANCVRLIHSNVVPHLVRLTQLPLPDQVSYMCPLSIVSISVFAIAGGC